MTPTLELAIDLIRRESVTPADAGCQEVMMSRLEAIGFKIERMRFGEVENFWARRGTEGPLFAFAGHTDVVPSGPLDAWSSPPFAPEIRDGMLYGRGAADMKGSLAAMVTAAESFVAAHPNHKGSIAFLITSDEEGVAVDGTVRVIRALSERGEKIDWCLVGEPSCNDNLGDCVKNGRRGSLNGDLTVLGVQGHVAYPHRALNPLHAFAPTLTRLCAEEWDRGNDFFPPTSFQISNLNTGTGADNVIPGKLEAKFNFRYSTEQTVEGLIHRFEHLLDQGDFDYDLRWRPSGPPFLTTPGVLVEALREAIRAETGLETELSTAGGTSDGRFIAPTGAQVVEFGPLNATIHKVDECVGVEELEQLSRIFSGVLERLLAPE